MTTPNRLLYLTVIGLLATGLMGGPSVWGQSAAPCQDHAILYQRAVSLLDQAQKKLDNNYTAEAKELAKEANSLFSTLQKECAQELSKHQLTPRQAEQQAINNRLAADSFAQGERLMKSYQQKFAKSQTLEKEGQDQLSIKYLSGAKKDADLAHKMHVKSMIYALRNQQLQLSFIKKSP